jgi:hypothetical protein
MTKLCIQGVTEMCGRILDTSSTYQKNKKCPYQPVSGNIYFVRYSWKNIFIISAQNVLHEIQCTPRHVSSWTATSVQRCRGSCGQSDRHPQCDGEVSLCCQQKLYTQGLLGITTNKNAEDSNAVWSAVAMHWFLLYVSVGHDRCYWEHLAQHGAPTRVYHIRTLTASGTSSSSFGRSCERKSL